MDLADLREMCDRHIETARKERDKNRLPVIGTFCSYAPVEILHSFGVLPLRVWGRAEDVDVSGTLLQPFVCPPVRHLMAMGLEGRYSFLDGIVHCYTCDATCGLYNIWERNMKPAFSHMVSLPYMALAESLEYALAEFGVLVEKLESFTARDFSPRELERSVGLYAQARSLIAEAYRLKAAGVPLGYADIHRMNLCLQTLPVETTVTLLEGCLEQARAMGAAKSRGARILLSGSVITDTALVEFVEASGCSIVADDTCMGWRLVEDPPPQGGNPLEALARYYIDRTPCASRADFPSREAYLLRAVERSGADAVIFVHQKFCDPHLADHPFLKDVLAAAGVPSMQVEIEGESFNSQVRTRVEGFFEMIGAG